MKTRRNNGGFSLIELLTVIAIIAILAAIIYPAMTAVKNNANRTQCITNMHNIAMALKMFQQDNRRYPETLSGYVKYDAGSNPIPFERTTATATTGDGLYPEYVKSVKGFHCPLSQTTATNAVAELTVGGEKFEYYAYVSYDVFTPTLVPSRGRVTITPDEVRYTVFWAADVAQVDTLLQPYPPGTPISPDLANYDFKRQLRFRNPPDDTVVTWCDYHQRTGRKVPVLFLDGHSDLIATEDVVACKYRVQPAR